VIVYLIEMCQLIPIKKTHRDISFLKKLNEREMLIWISEKITIKKLIIILNITDDFKSFYAPSISRVELNKIKKESFKEIKQKTITQKALIENFRKQGILILYVNQSIIQLYQNEIAYNKIHANDEFISELKRFNFNFSPIFELKITSQTSKINMKSTNKTDKKTADKNIINKLKKAKKETKNIESIVDMEGYHKLHGIRVNIKNLDDNFEEK